MTAYRTIPVTEAVQEKTLIYPAQLLRLSNPLCYSNAHLVGEDWFVRFRLQCARARDVQIDEVFLGQYPRGSMLLGIHTHYILLEDNILVRNQIMAGGLSIIEATMGAIHHHVRQTKDVEQPCVCLCRYGAVTWGHWLGELLTKAIAVEDAFPRTFSYAVPAEIIDPHGRYQITVDEKYASAILGSLAAYGIDRDRIIPIDPAANYRFSRLMDVHATFIDNLIHPGVMRAMQANVTRSTTRLAKSNRLAILRRDAQTRQIHNNQEIEDWLRRAEFTFVVMSELSFPDRVAILNEIDTVFGIWGSGFIYLSYARQNTKVLSVAPTNWYDNGFTGLFQQQKCRFADVRGPSIWSGDGAIHHAPFVINVSQLEEGLQHLDNPKLSIGPGPRGFVNVMGTSVPSEVSASEFVLDFTRGGNAWPILETGWSVQEESHVWSIGSKSTLSLPASELSGDYILEIDGSSYIFEPYHTCSPLSVSVNGSELGSFVVDGRCHLMCRLPAECFAGYERLRFLFSHPVCPSPWSLGQGSDDRPLGFCFVAIRFRRLVQSE